MGKWTIGAIAAILVGEGILAKIIVDSHNLLIEAIEQGTHHYFGYWYYMGWRRHEEKAEYDNR